MNYPNRLSKRLTIVPLALATLATAGAPLVGQPADPDLPYATGEVLTYTAVSGRFGTFGQGTMRVEPDVVRGDPVHRFSFDFKGRVGPFKVDDRTRSWVTRGEMASMRYRKTERSPLGSRDEAVEIYPAERRWHSASGASGRSETAHPLDELSFIYYLRSLPLRNGDEYTLTRHFDTDRNPVHVKVLRRERTRVPAGEFPTVVVEMRVRDGRLSEKNGAMRFYLTDDSDRIPVRIESSAPWVGSTNLLLVEAQRAS